METTEQGSGGSGLKNLMLVVLSAGVVGLGTYSITEHRSKNRLKEELKLQIAEVQNKNVKTYEAIENNLAEINAREGLIPVPRKETSTTSEERIAQSISAIEMVMMKNRELIENLKSTVGERDKKLLRFQKMMAKLEKRIADYKTSTESLAAQTGSLKKDLDLANQMRVTIGDELAIKEKQLSEKAETIEKQSAVLSEKDKQLHTAYYTVGSMKELKENNIVDTDGGFLWLGKSKKLKNDFNKQLFNKIDIYTYTSIPVFSKDAEIITSHSSDSYEIMRGPNDEVQWVKITKPEKFWENSKYLVVVKKGESTTASAAVYEK